MNARRDKGESMRAVDAQGREKVRQRVDAAKQALGERGAVWWTDDAPDWNRRMVRRYALCGVVRGAAGDILRDGQASGRPPR
jgi:hypothetical protein